MKYSIDGLFLLCVFVLVSTFVVFNVTKKPLILDSVEYQYAAENVLNVNTLYAGNIDNEVDYRLFSKRTIGYPLFLLFQQNNPLFVHLSQLLLVVFNVILSFHILRNEKANKSSVLFFFCMIILSPVVFFHSQFVLADLLLATIITTIVAVFTDTTIENNKKHTLLAILWAFGLAIKPALLPSLLAIPFLLIWFYVAKRKLFLSYLLPIVCWALLSWLNYNNIKQFELSSISTINVAHYNAKLTIAKKHGIDSAQSFTENDIFKIPRSIDAYSAYKANLNRVGTTTILSNFSTYLKVHFLGSVKMILDPGRFEIYTFFNEPTSNKSLTELLFAGNWEELKTELVKNKLLVVLFVFLLIVNLVKLPFFVVSLNRPNEAAVFKLVIIAYFIGLTGPIGAARFMLPAMFVYLTLVSIGLSKTLKFFQKSSKG